MSFSFQIRYIKSTFFWIIGLYEIKVPLIKLENFTTKFYPRSLFCELLLAVFACNINAVKKSFYWNNDTTEDGGMMPICSCFYWYVALLMSCTSNGHISRVSIQIPLLIDTVDSKNIHVLAIASIVFVFPFNFHQCKEIFCYLPKLYLGFFFLI